MNGLEASNSFLALMAATAIKRSIRLSTCTMRRTVLHRGSANTPRPATPKTKIAPSVRAVSAVRVHGHTLIAQEGARNIVSPKVRARIPTAAAASLPLLDSTRSSAAAGVSWRRLASHTPKTSSGVVKYSPAQSQKAT